MGYFTLIKTFGPWVLIALLIGAVLYMRTDLVATAADRDKAQAAVTELAAVNTANAAAIEKAKAVAAINDQTVIDLTTTIMGLRAKSLQSQQTVTKVISNDPVSKTWADLPVPDELRGAIN